ncbi:hypothetical protein TA3x_005542 [Tundrisphaera sp. TA3]
MLGMILIYAVLSILFLVAGVGIWILRGNGLRDLLGRSRQDREQPRT